MQNSMIYVTHCEVVGVGVEVVHPRIPKIAQEVVGVGRSSEVEDTVGVVGDAEEE